MNAPKSALPDQSYLAIQLAPQGSGLTVGDLVMTARTARAYLVDRAMKMEAGNLKVGAEMGKAMHVVSQLCAMRRLGKQLAKTNMPVESYFSLPLKGEADTVESKQKSVMSLVKNSGPKPTPNTMKNWDQDLPQAMVKVVDAYVELLAQHVRGAKKAAILRVKNPSPRG